MDNFPIRWSPEEHDWAEGYTESNPDGALTQ